MACFKDSCQHINEITDVSQGDIICLDCGMINPFFIENEMRTLKNVDRDFFTTTDIEKSKSKDSSLNLLEKIKDILAIIHVSTVYAEHIKKYLDENYRKKSLENIVMSIFIVLNRMDFQISMHELSLVTGIDKSKLFEAQKSNTNIFLDKATLAEKYCKMLNLNFDTITLIKERIRSSKITGHTPMTVIAGNIYKVVRDKKLKFSVKKISTVTNVSCISIQRYIKTLK